MPVLGGDSWLGMSKASPLNPDWCLKGGGKHVFTRRSVFNICIGRFYMSPHSEDACSGSPSGIWSPCQVPKRCNRILQASKYFAYVTPKSLSGPATLCKAVLTEEKLRSLLKDAQRISDRAREKTSLSYIPATSYDLLFLLLVY